MQQDFSKRMIIVARDDIEGWQQTNTVGHISAYLGNKLAERFGTGENFTTSDGANYPRNSQFPIIIKRANSSEQLHTLLGKVRATGLLHHAFVREMIDFTDDAELDSALAQKTDADIELLGVGVFGQNEEAALLTKKFGLWK